MSKGSRLPGFHKAKIAERLRRLAEAIECDEEDLAGLAESASLPLANADAMIENAVGVLGLPVGIALNFVIDGEELVIPMAVEEPSVVAACSLAAKLARAGGGFTTESSEPRMIGQVQITQLANPEAARELLLANRAQILEAANALHPQMRARGGGCRELEVRLLDVPEDVQGNSYQRQVILHLLVDTQDAMGANLVNTMCEGVAPLCEKLTGGKVRLRILSNLADQRLSRARVRIPIDALADFGLTGEEVARGIADASRFADADPYRACTHNKGVMNGVDAVVMATGNDWRAVEAGAHAYAARNGQYSPLAIWRVGNDGQLEGTAELPLALGIVGGAVRAHPGVRLALEIAGIRSARELAELAGAVGLASNLAALKALASTGIQKGHMALHARSVAAEAGAKGEQIERVALILAREGDYRLERAQAVLREVL